MDLQAIAEGSHRVWLDGVAIDADALGAALSMSGHRLVELVISRADLTDVNTMVMVGAHLRRSAVEELRLVNVNLTDAAAVSLIGELIESSVHVLEVSGEPFKKTVVLELFRGRRATSIRSLHVKGVRCNPLRSVFREAHQRQLGNSLYSLDPVPRLTLRCVLSDDCRFVSIAGYVSRMPLQSDTLTEELRRRALHAHILKGNAFAHVLLVAPDGFTAISGHQDLMGKLIPLRHHLKNLIHAPHVDSGFTLFLRDHPERGAVAGLNVLTDDGCSVLHELVSIPQVPLDAVEALLARPDFYQVANQNRAGQTAREVAMSCKRDDLVRLIADHEVEDVALQVFTHEMKEGARHLRVEFHTLSGGLIPIDVHWRMDGQDVIEKVSQHLGVSMPVQLRIFIKDAVIKLHPKEYPRRFLLMSWSPVWSAALQLSRKDDYHAAEAELVRLLQHPAAPLGLNMQIENGDTLLHVIVKAGSITALQALADRADFETFDSVNDRGYTAHDLAFDWPQAAEVLQQRWTCFRIPDRVAEPEPVARPSRKGLKNKVLNKSSASATEMSGPPA